MAMSPMMQQYFEIKNQYRDHILMYRLGDFYEMFFDDAKLVSSLLDLALTGRDCGEEERAPMCGVPFHKADVYIGKLVELGYKVAICEQMEDPALAKGLVKREVIKVITPGTLTEASLLPETKNNYLCAVYFSTDDIGLAFADISTGQVKATSLKGETAQARLESELGAYSPSEIIVNTSFSEHQRLKKFISEHLHSLIDEEQSLRFDENEAAKHCLTNFGNEKCAALLQCRPALLAVGALFSYISETQMTDISYVNDLDFYIDGSYLEIDINTRRNLELTETLKNKDKKGSLLYVLDKTKTSMGARMLRTWLLQPLRSLPEILRRQEAVNALFGDFMARQELREALSKVLDLERLTAKVVYGSANARDMLAILSSISSLPEIRDILVKLPGDEFTALCGSFDTLDDIRTLLTASINPEASLTLREGGLIADGYDDEVDRLRGIRNGGDSWKREIEEREKEATGIKSLRVGYNKVFGYYIEITNSFKDQVPERYIRKQTLTGCERYITEELKDMEATVLGASDKLCAIEYNIFQQIRESVAEKSERLHCVAECVAKLDTFASLAEAAKRNNYIKPEIGLSDTISIKDGRHPVVEQFVSDNYFVPNDTLLDTGKNRLMLITGPNMAGKSTYMRQVALIQLMAQTGSFVPASDASLPIVDKIFTRVGASDDLASGQSTFMLEMNEVAYILKNATNRSLIIYDEIGRGTSTYDGMSIARAVAEYTLSKKIGAKTLFATHYHELTVLEDEFEGVVNYNIAAKKRGEDIVFLRKIVRGSTDDSYGIEVAKLAGVPSEVIKRAKAVLSDIENGKIVIGEAKSSAPRESNGLLSEIENSIGDEICSKLRATDINTLTPIEAMNLIYELKKML